MIDNGVINSPYCFNTHHIVAQNEWEADDSRKILADYNIDINSAANGVYLPASGGKDYSYVITESLHFGGHLKSYFKYIIEADKTIVAKGNSKEIKSGDTISDATREMCNYLDDLRKDFLDRKIPLQGKED